MKKSFKTLLKEYFDFSKGERNAVFVLTFVTIAISVYPLIGLKNNNPIQTDFSLIKNIASASESDSGKGDEYREVDNFKEYPEQKGYFEKTMFDPNTASLNDLVTLGFTKYVAERIVKYRNAGGKFFIKSDITKIYGINADFAAEIMPYIDLPEKRTFAQKSRYPESFSEKKVATQLIDINTADTFTLNQLKGIGNKLSQRIVSFREKLGGFYSLDQLSEVYGLKAEVIAEIKPKFREEFSPVRLININTANFQELSSHPYIRKNLAYIIINYRTQHGPFDSINELLKIKVLDDNAFLKLKNYLKV